MKRPPRFVLSLRATLVLAMVMVAAVALVAAFLVTRRATDQRLEAFYESFTLDQDARRLDDYRTERGSWAGVESLLARIGRPYDERLIIASTSGDVIADSDLDGPNVDLASLTGDVDFVHGDDRAVLYTLGRARSDLVDDTRDDLDRWYVIAGGLALLVAAAAAVLMGRRIVRPLTSVARTAERMAVGDLTARSEVRSPPEIAALGATLDAMAGELQESEGRRRTMVADVAHELRSPVANLRAYIEAMVDGVATPSGDDLAVVVDEIQRLDHLIGDLQDLALADANQLRFDPVTCDIEAVLRRAAGAAGARATEAGVDLVVRVEPGCPPVRADPDRLHQILSNLVENALRYSPAGQAVTLEAGPSTGLDRRVVQIRVSDRGPGLGAEADRVFDRFWRADASRTRSRGGTGLGLAISRGLAELQGGTLAAADRPDGGAAFALTLPAP